MSAEFSPDLELHSNQ